MVILCVMNQIIICASKQIRESAIWKSQKKNIEVKTSSEGKFDHHWLYHWVLAFYSPLNEMVQTVEAIGFGITGITFLTL